MRREVLTMEESFVKDLDDSSLAMLVQSTPESSTRPESRDRSLRVHQQVQLTLARNTRRTLLNGGAHLQKNSASSFDGIDGFSQSSKVDGSGFTSRSLSGGYEWKPSRKVKVSPTPSPDVSLPRFNYSTNRHGVHSSTRRSQHHTVEALPVRSWGSDSFRRYAISDGRHGSYMNASSTCGLVRFNKTLRMSTKPQGVSGAAALQQNPYYNPPWNYKQKSVKQETRPEQGHKNATFGHSQPDRGMTWPAQVKRDLTQRSMKLKSIPPFGVRAEVDMGRRAETELATQQIQSEKVTVLTSGNKPEMTLRRAVDLLTQKDEETLILAAGYIQNRCSQEANDKYKLHNLRGIEKLLQLLSSNSEEVQCVTAGALRNATYHCDENKKEVEDKGGLPLIMQTLSNSQDKETRRHLTGILWSLSSHDQLKERFAKESINVLTKSVVVPGSGFFEGENPKAEMLADDDAFNNATGCLCNLSSAGLDVRSAMRKCENLIDSLVYFIRATVANKKTDDQPTRNCICILQNLTFQIESELQQHRESQQNQEPETTSVGCFSNRSAKISRDGEHEPHLLEEKADPQGIEWLWSPITIRMYLSLLACNTLQATQKATIGALQNITTGKTAINKAVAFTIVQREKGLVCINKVLEEGVSKTKKMVISLISNLSRYQELHSNIVNDVLSNMVKMLPCGDSSPKLCREATITVFYILNNLSMSDTKHAEAIIKLGALKSITSISQTYGNETNQLGQVASVLLYNIWRDTDLHETLKVYGYEKSDFINALTKKAVKSMKK